MTLKMAEQKRFDFYVVFTFAPLNLNFIYPANILKIASNDLIKSQYLI